MKPRGLRLITTGIGLAAGLTFAYYGLGLIENLLGLELGLPQRVGAITLITVITGLIGFFIAPGVLAIIRQLGGWFQSTLQRTPVQDIVSGAVGLIVGLIIANLLGSAFSRIPGLGLILPTVGSIVFGYIGIFIAVTKRDELIALIPGLGRIKGRDRAERHFSGQPKILDTSVIIDGRIADICQTGFIEGPLIIPGFVLEELRHIADSSDTLKRNRGRRGLDVLNRIQKDLDIQVQIYDKDFAGHLEVDSKLVRLAKVLDGKVITNDFNLNKIAELQGVRVLNINELANAVKPVVLPGEEMIVHVIKDGKESGQGVAYLDDGTMIVVDGGKRHIGDTIGVLVTSVLQTAAGRMIFAKPKNLSEKAIQ